MIDKALLAKIKKCMALARSSNEHEAAAALAKARALMDEHGVDDATLALADVEESTARASRTVKPLRWETYLCRTVERALNVVSFVAFNGDRTFVGRGPSAEIAAYAFAVLFRRLKAARADYITAHLRRCRPGRKRQRADVFCEAWALAVHSTIAKLHPEPSDDPLIVQYLAKVHPGLGEVATRGASTKGRNTASDFWRGHDAGRAVELNQGVAGAQAPLMLA